MEVVVMFRQWWCFGGEVAVVAAGRVRESGVEDRIDRGIWSIFGFAGKIPPEKFSGGGRRVVAAGGRRSKQTSPSKLPTSAAQTKRPPSKLPTPTAQTKRPPSKLPTPTAQTKRPPGSGVGGVGGVSVEKWQWVVLAAVVVAATG
nr:hypothetical protein [Tanacetum cinerariifolium]